MPDRWTLKTPFGDLQLNATFHAPKYQPGGVDGATIMRRDDRLTYQRSGDGLATPGPFRLVGRVWRDDHDIAALVDELRDLREAVAACTQVVRSTGQGTYTYDQLAGGPPPAISPDGLGGFTVEIELWPGEADPTYVPVITLRYITGKTTIDNSGSATEHTFTPPAEAQPGDLLIVGLAANSTFEGFTDWDGWTHLHTAIASGTIVDRESVVAYLVVPDPVPASWTWKWNNDTSGVAGAMALYRDQDENDPIARDAWLTGPSTPPNVTVALGSAAFAFFRRITGIGGDVELPDGMTPVGEGVSVTNAHIAAGAEDNLPAGAYQRTGVNLNAESSSSVVIINPRGAPEPPTPIYGPIELISFENTSGSGTNRVIPVPTGAAQDDILVTVIAYNSNGGSYVDLQGFTPALQMRYAASSNRWTDVLWRALPATPPASYTIETSGAIYADITTFAFRNVDPANPILDADWDEATALVHPLPAVTAADGAAAIGVWRTTSQTLPDGDPEMTFVASGGGTNIQRYVGYELGLEAGPYSRSRSAGANRTYNRGVVLLRKR